MFEEGDVYVERFELIYLEDLHTHNVKVTQSSNLRCLQLIFPSAVHIIHLPQHLDSDRRHASVYNTEELSGKTVKPIKLRKLRLKQFCVTVLCC